MNVGRQKTMSLKTSKDILRKWEQQVLIFKNTDKPYQTSFKQVMSMYMYYDKKFFYKELKPFLVKKKNITQLVREGFISTKKSKRRKKITITEKDRIDVGEVFNKRIQQNWGNDPRMYNHAIFD